MKVVKFQVSNIILTKGPLGKGKGAKYGRKGVEIVDIQGGETVYSTG